MKTGMYRGFGQVLEPKGDNASLVALPRAHGLRVPSGLPPSGRVGAFYILTPETKLGHRPRYEARSSTFNAREIRSTAGGNPTVEVDVTLDDGSTGRAACASQVLRPAPMSPRARRWRQVRYGGKGRPQGRRLP